MAQSITFESGRAVNDDDFLTPGLINQLFRAAVITLSGTVDASQLAAKAVTASKLEFGSAWFGTGGGSATAHTVTITSDITAHADALLIRYRVPADSTGAVTLAVTADGGTWTGTKALKKENGRDITAGDLRNGQEIWVSYSSADDCYYLLSGTLDYGMVVGDTTGSSNAYALGATSAPKEITTYKNGVPFLFRANFTNTGAATLNVCGIGAKNLKKNGGNDVEAGDIVADKFHLAIYDSTDDVIELISVLSIITPVAVVGSTRNLHIRSKSGSEDTTLEISADEIVLKNGINDAVVAAFTSTSELVITASGDLGLDTGSEATSTWYYIWAFYDESDGSTTYKFSTSSTNPTAGDYTHKALIGAIYNNSSGNLIKINQRDRWVDTEVQNVLDDGQAATANTWESLSLTGEVPSIAVSIRGIFGHTANVNPSTDSIAIAADANGVGQVLHRIPQNTTAEVFGYDQASNYFLHLRTAQTLYWQANTNTQANNRIDITGYQI